MIVLATARSVLGSIAAMFHADAVVPISVPVRLIHLSAGAPALAGLTTSASGARVTAGTSSALNRTSGTSTLRRIEAGYGHLA